MPQTTFGVPYPDPSEPVAEGAARIRDVAEALDTRVLAGSLAWGPLGAPDVTLQRQGGGTIGLNVAQTNAYGHFVLDAGNGGGRLWFGSAFDTSLYRGAANQIKTDGTFAALGPWIGAAVNAGAGETLIGALGPAGQASILFANDASLFRYGPAVLQTDGLRVAATLEITSSVNFGPLGAADTNLYRAGAGILSTDSKLRVGGLLRLPIEGSTALGSVIGRIRIADLDESFIGYLPVYGG